MNERSNTLDKLILMHWNPDSKELQSTEKLQNQIWLHVAVKDGPRKMTVKILEWAFKAETPKLKVRGIEVLQKSGGKASKGKNSMFPPDEIESSGAWENLSLPQHV